MKNKLKWRLGKLPSPDEVIMLVKDKLITNEEAREILFNEETEEDRDKESLQSEIKFLRELVNKIGSKNIIVEQIRYIEKPYQSWNWYPSYGTWCSSGNTPITSTSGTLNLQGQGSIGSGINSISYLSTDSTNGGALVGWNDDSQSFTDISTF